MKTKDIKFKYVVLRPNGFTFEKIFTLDEIEKGETVLWRAANQIGDNCVVTVQQCMGLDHNNKEIYV